jgi:hypothetical protein
MRIEYSLDSLLSDTPTTRFSDELKKELKDNIVGLPITYDFIKSKSFIGTREIGKVDSIEDGMVKGSIDLEMEGKLVAGFELEPVGFIINDHAGEQGELVIDDMKLIGINIVSNANGK